MTPEPLAEPTEHRLATIDQLAVRFSGGILPGEADDADNFFADDGQLAALKDAVQV